MRRGVALIDTYTYIFTLLQNHVYKTIYIALNRDYMTIHILENSKDDNDDIDLCTLHNIDVIPRKGDQLSIDGHYYIVDDFLWHIYKNKDRAVSLTMWVDKE